MKGMFHLDWTDSTYFDGKLVLDWFGEDLGQG